MSIFRVTLNGRNFHLEWEGAISRTGFYTYRDVAAENAEEAEHIAVQMMREHELLRECVKNSIEDPPAIHVDGIEEIEIPEATQPGLIFYPEKVGSSWWQFWKRNRPSKPS